MRSLILFCILPLLSVPTCAQNALSFDGVDDKVLTNAPGPLGSAPRTVEAWVNQTASSTIQEVVASWGSMSTGERFTLNLINGLPRIEVGGSGFSGTTPLTAGTWYHLAATYSTAQDPPLRLFVDGVQVAAGTPTVTVNTSNATPVFIGMRTDSINHFNGRIDELRIWNTARTATEIAATRFSEYCTVPATLLRYYKMNEGMAGAVNTGVTVATDVGSASSPGDLQGFALTGTVSNWVAGAPVQNTVSSTQVITSCPPWESPSGNSHSTSGTYVDTVAAAITGCDRIITTTLIITPLNTQVTQEGVVLSAGSSGSGTTYQWLDCDNGMAAIPGATAPTFTATVNGNYAVQVGFQACLDTSACNLVDAVGMAENDAVWTPRMYPVPADDQLFLEGAGGATFRIVDGLGRTVLSGSIGSGPQEVVRIDALAAGRYTVLLQRNAASVRSPFVKR